MSLCYSQCTLTERRRLYHLKERKLPIGESAGQVGRLGKAIC
jgi:IS30 family transposase